MKISKRHYPILISLGILALYLLTRLFNLMDLPIFTDEAIYVRWAQTALDDPAQRFISLTDGKQPLFIWVGSASLAFISNDLLAVRLVSVTAGLATVVGLWLLANELFKDRRVAFLTSFIYVIYPFALICDRLALYDSMVGTLAVWSLYLQVLLVRRRRLDVALITALVMGAGLLTKSSALFFIYLMPASLLLFDFKAKTRSKDFLKLLGLAAIVVIGALVCALLLRLSPYFYFIADKNTVFIVPVKEWVEHPLMYLANNSKSLLLWLIGYLTIPVILAVVAAPFIRKDHFKEKLLLFVWFIAPLGALALFGKLIFPRFIFFMTLPLLVLAAYTLIALTDKVKNNGIKAGIIIVTLSGMLGTSFYIVTDISRAPIPETDRSQLVESYTSGIGVEETVSYLIEQSRAQQIYVGTEGIFGLMPDSLQVSFRKDPNVVIKGYWPITADPPEELLQRAGQQPTYFVFYAPCPELCDKPGEAPKDWPLEKVFQIKRPDGTYYTLYRVKP